VVGATLGGEEAGASYKILSLVGHGAKTVDLFAFGPEPLFPGNCWSEDTDRYGSIADALRLVGRAENLLYPGTPARGNVAILLPDGSKLWDDSGADRLYEEEIPYLHQALTHAGYTVDFVDNTDLAQGALTQRGYTTLYVTSPNVSAAAQAAVAGWVNGGGTLVVTPGGAVADEYNDPTTTLDAVLGLQSRQAIRDDSVQGVFVADTTLTLQDPAFGTDSMGLYGPIAPLHPTGATVAATLGTGVAGITRNRYGAGTAIAYAFFPGDQYFRSPDRRYGEQSSEHWLPQHWGDLQRQVAVEPAALAHTPRPVIVSTPGVEAELLQSDKGLAIVLLNWTDQPISQLTVTVPNADHFFRARSAQGVDVQTQVQGDSVTITLPLDHVDVVMLDNSSVTVGPGGALQVGNLPTTASNTITINDAGGGVQLTLDGVEYDYAPGQITSITVNGGTSSDLVNVEGSLPTVPITLNLGGPSTVNVGSTGNSLVPVQGALAINGGGVTNVTFNNQGANPQVAHTDVWSADHVEFSYTNPAQNLQVDFSGVAQVTLNDPGATTNEHLFYATPAVGGLTINGAGNDIIGATVPVNGTNNWRITGYRSGTLNGVIAFNHVYDILTAGNSAASGTDVFHFLPAGFMDAVGLQIDHATLDFSQFTPGITVNLPDANGFGSVPGVIVNLSNNPGLPATLSIIGTAGNDTFRFATGGGVSGRIIGGGTATLDYSASVGDITVDLGLGTATGVGGGVAGIANVTGSQGNDILVGDANANVLVGRTGRNLIIGGGGADQLFGGGGDNILIGGTTAYDQNLTALQAIMNEFTRTDLNFHQRVAHIMNGTGLNGSYVLNTDPTQGPVTVFDDGAADVLNAGGALDWFFANKSQDRIVNKKPGDKINHL
jgi:hypothetical protein